jgi:hypothetical protein
MGQASVATSWCGWLVELEGACQGVHDVLALSISLADGVAHDVAIHVLKPTCKTAWKDIQAWKESWAISLMLSTNLFVH